MVLSQSNKQVEPPTDLTSTTSNQPVKVRRAHVCEKCGKKCPCLVAGGLPPELQLMALRRLSVQEVTKVSTTCAYAKAIVEVHGKYLAKPLIKLQRERLRREAAFLNFEGLSFVAAWRRLSQTVDINGEVYGDLDDMVLRLSLAFSYAWANPGPRLPGRDTYFDILETLLGISDWCRWYKGDLQNMTWPASRLNAGRWKSALGEAFLDRGEYMPGKYTSLVLVFRDEAPGVKDPSFIIQAFEELRADPLEDYWREDLSGCTAVPNKLQAKLKSQVGISTSFHGLEPFFAHRHSLRAEKLIHQLYWEHKSREGLLFAALLKELEIKWKRTIRWS